MSNKSQALEAIARDAVLVEDAHVRPMMGLEILEPVPTRSAPYERLDPFTLVHESRLKLSELEGVDTKHPHRGFDNLWFILEGRPAPGTAPGRAGPSSGSSCPGGRFWRFGRAGGPGTPSESARRNAIKIAATASGGACCSG
jgi:hypothetical protein